MTAAEPRFGGVGACCPCHKKKSTTKCQSFDGALVKTGTVDRSASSRAIHGDPATWAIHHALKRRKQFPREEKTDAPVDFFLIAKLEGSTK